MWNYKRCHLLVPVQQPPQNDHHFHNKSQKALTGQENEGVVFDTTRLSQAIRFSWKMPARHAIVPDTAPSYNCNEIALKFQLFPFIQVGEIQHRIRLFLPNLITHCKYWTSRISIASSFHKPALFPTVRSNLADCGFPMKSIIVRTEAPAWNKQHQTCSIL